MRDDAITAWNVAGKRTMIFIYYSGHGVMDNYTYVVSNETPVNGQVKKYALEFRMRNIGAEEGAFVLGILDCCREKIPVPTKAGNGD